MTRVRVGRDEGKKEKKKEKRETKMMKMKKMMVVVVAVAMMMMMMMWVCRQKNQRMCMKGILNANVRISLPRTSSVPFGQARDSSRHISSPKQHPRSHLIPITLTLIILIPRH